MMKLVTWESTGTGNNCMVSSWMVTDANPLVILVIASKDEEEEEEEEEAAILKLLQDLDTFVLDILKLCVFIAFSMFGE
ncbi:hypothetical protein Cadr_000002789 [Camelus dromedarius]|uniref:Uncharacterized protein n=1 Tax=Camelus dromedarius TaxID=9838 RepID=A0A5N4C3V6_CAMDR|nr:hypothetical protein Cadr_000002789 [Camelus dromedarius]